MDGEVVGGDDGIWEMVGNTATGKATLTSAVDTSIELTVINMSKPEPPASSTKKDSPSSRTAMM